ncbi:hypothetical protein EDC94DRAFT_656123 [Helicostylum pulchrum]|nr:hypothetical protein EDC94DRAFT_656123 [Helicostylum pulchrum]
MSVQNDTILPKATAVFVQLKKQENPPAEDSDDSDRMNNAEDGNDHSDDDDRTWLSAVAKGVAKDVAGSKTEFKEGEAAKFSNESSSTESYCTLQAGREYPAGYQDFFRPKLKAAFLKKKDVTDEQEILKSIQFGEYIIKG